MRLPRGFVKPSYDGKGISSIPATALELLGVDALEDVPRLDRRCYEEYIGRVDKVVVFVVDSLGYNLFARCLRRSASLRAWVEGVKLLKLTSVFPSTTASAVVTLSTGRTPQEHGVVGYNVYLKEYGTVANMIRLSPAHSPASNELVGLGLSPETFLGLPTIYELLGEAGVKSYVLLRWAYAKSGLSLLTTRGAEVERYATAADMMVRARKLAEGSGSLLISMYWDGLDLVCHARTPNSEEAEAEVASTMYLLRDVLAKPTGSGAAKSTLLMVTGDHGQSFVGEGGLLVANEEQELLRLLMVPPTGEARVSYLYPAEGAASDVKECLKEKFGRNCVILDSERALRAGLFGRGRAREGVESRIGGLVALPKPGFGLKYFFREREEEDARKLPRGAHGGLTEDEQLVPLLIGTLDEFRGRW